jgi:hypothetical protein
MENTDNIDKMTTLSQVMAKLAQRGVHREFRMNENCEMKFENSELSAFRINDSKNVSF